MDREKIKILIKEQRAYFFTGATREEAYRIQALRKLRAWILKNQAEIEEALKKGSREKQDGKRYVRDRHGAGGNPVHAGPYP